MVRREVIDRRYLSQAMDSCGKDLETAEDIADDIRSRYGYFAGMIRQKLLREVRQILHERNIKKRVKDEERYDNDGGDEEGSAAAQRKKQRRVDDEIEQRAEQSHLRKRKMERSPSSSTSSAIYSEKLSPQFDLINDSLRDNYAAKLNNNSSKNVEVEEIVSNKGSRSKLATMGARKEDAKQGSLSADVVSEGPMFKDFGGIKKIMYELEKNVLFPIFNPNPYKIAGAKPPSGILFHGPPGCGKTKLAYAIANEAGVPFYKISATDVVSGVSGTSEENIRELFSKAYRTAPSIVFIDEIDAIGSKRENLQREMEKRIVTQLLTCMDGPPNSNNAGYVLVIGATNRPDALDPALRRSGRFECEISLSAPDEDARAEILSVVAQKVRLVEGSFDMKKIARLTPGFVGADLNNVANSAAKMAIERILDSKKSQQSSAEDDKSWLRQLWTEEDYEKLFIKISDFEGAVNLVQPSLTREGFSVVPDVKWDDIGGLDHIRHQLNLYLVRPIKKPEIHKAVQVSVATGFLLYGPPGCGKTLIAKAAANEVGANFMHIKAAELLNKYVGESELAIRTLFQRARTCAPCVIFFDEVDAITTRRGDEGAWVVERLLTQFLVELDGGERRDVYVIGATNRPDVIDDAFLRPGRFGNCLYVPLPNADERASILKAIAKKKPIDPSVDLDGIAKLNCEGFSGADLADLVQKAAFQLVDEMIRSQDDDDDVIDTSKCMIKTTHFEQALPLVSPSVNIQEIKRYESISKRFERKKDPPVTKKKKKKRKEHSQVTIGPSFALGDLLTLLAEKITNSPPVNMSTELAETREELAKVKETAAEQQAVMEAKLENMQKLVEQLLAGGIGSGVGPSTSTGN